MRLTSLEIKGFKSFGDKIIINFNEGVTAIAGPNGCGKSNVVDAIRWVLGEQSTRTLRSEKMDNIIFNGSRSRKPANLAEVSLTFDNTKNILPVEYSQVTITRKLYRNGDSEYRLNDVQCRLKDITDLFLDTGIGSDSYAIIELRMVEEIISNKEGSRRNLFEEASGISKYKLRKKQTFNKLKDTEADLERVNDLLFEIEKNLKTLENQAKKTERYYRIRDQYKALSVILASFRIASFSQSLSDIEEKQQVQEAEKLGIAAQIDTLEATLQKNRLDSLNKEKNLALQQKATNEHVAKIRAYESEKKIKNQQLKFQQDKESLLIGELERDRNQLNHVLYNIKRLTEEKIQENEKLDTIAGKVTELKLLTDELKQQQASDRRELLEITTYNNNLQNQVYRAEKDFDILQIQQRSLEQEAGRNMEDAGSKEVELTHFTHTVAGLQERATILQNEHQFLADAENQIQLQISAKETELIKIREMITVESRKLDARQNEYNLTKSMVDNLEGFPESLRFLKKNADWVRDIPLFSDILYCQEEYRIAIENYLEPLMNYYVVNNYDEAISAINLLSKSAKGRAQFFVLDSYTTQNQPDRAVSGSNPEEETSEKSEIKAFPTAEDCNAPGIVPAQAVIDVDTYYQSLINHLLKDVYLIDDHNEQVLNNLALPEKVVLLSRSGKFNKSKYTMAGGSVGLFEGKRIGRAKKLENLAKELKQLDTRVNFFKDQLQELQIKMEALKVSGKAEEIKKKIQEVNNLNTELVTVKTRQEQYQAFIDNSLNRKQDIAKKIFTLKEEMLSLQPLLARLKTDKQVQNDVLLSKQAVFNELNEHILVQSNVYNQENIRYHQHQNKVSGLSKDIGYRETQKEQLEVRININTVEFDKLKLAIQENLQHADNSDDDLLGMYAQKEQMENATREAEQAYYEWRGEISVIENEIAGLRRQKDNAGFIENELRDRRNSLKLELNALKERLSVEFNVDIQDLLDGGTPENESEEDLRDKTARLKKQMDDFGAINPMAVEAYNEMESRHQFIQAQKKDISDAKTSLLATIQEIDDTARDKFMIAFTAVRDNFITVFRSLFNQEDSCDLILSDPQHPLASEIDIIAKPKGKRPLSINQLSGGEKTLTATAILFSLYLLKPAPFCIFDEVDAPLDDTNIDKFNNIIREFSKDSQFIVVSHNKKTIASTDVIYGVTMVEQGISRVVPVDMRQMAN